MEKYLEQDVVRYDNWVPRKSAIQSLKERTLTLGNISILYKAVITGLISYIFIGESIEFWSLYSDRISNPILVAILSEVISNTVPLFDLKTKIEKVLIHGALIAFVAFTSFVYVNGAITMGQIEEVKASANARAIEMQKDRIKDMEKTLLQMNDEISTYNSRGHLISLAVVRNKKEKLLNQLDRAREGMQKMISTDSRLGTASQRKRDSVVIVVLRVLFQIINIGLAFSIGVDLRKKKSGNANSK